MKYTKKQRILAIIGIVILLLMYIVNLVLALIGSDAAIQMLKGTIVASIMLPIILYAMLVLMQKTSGFRTTPEEKLTEEEEREARRLMAMAEQGTAEPGEESLPGPDTDSEE